MYLQVEKEDLRRGRVATICSYLKTFLVQAARSAYRRSDLLEIQPTKNYKL